MQQIRTSALALCLLAGSSGAAFAQVPGGVATPAPAGSPVGAPQASASPQAMGSPSAAASPQAATSPTAMISPAAHMGGAMSGAMMQRKVLHVRLRPQNGSGETGSAVITQLPHGIRVVLKIKHGPAKAQPAHLHAGTCATLNPAPAFALMPVVGGMSTTTLPGLSIAMLLAKPYAINVHKSPLAIKTYVSCGNLLPMKAMTSPMK